MRAHQRAEVETKTYICGGMRVKADSDAGHRIFTRLQNGEMYIKEIAESVTIVEQKSNGTN